MNGWTSYAERRLHPPCPLGSSRGVRVLAAFIVCPSPPNQTSRLPATPRNQVLAQIESHGPLAVAGHAPRPCRKSLLECHRGKQHNEDFPPSRSRPHSAYTLCKTESLSSRPPRGLCHQGFRTLLATARPERPPMRGCSAPTVRRSYYVAPHGASNSRRTSCARRMAQGNRMAAALAAHTPARATRLPR